MLNLEDNQYNDIIGEAMHFNNNVEDLESLLHEICHYRFGYDKFPDSIDSDFDGKYINEAIFNKFALDDESEVYNYIDADRHEAECCIITAFALKLLGYSGWKNIPDLAFNNVRSEHGDMIKDMIIEEMSKESFYTKKAEELIGCINDLQGIME